MNCSMMRSGSVASCQTRQEVAPVRRLLNRASRSAASSSSYAPCRCLYSMVTMAGPAGWVPAGAGTATPSEQSLTRIR